MKNELYKFNLSRFSTVFFKDYNNIPSRHDDPTHLKETSHLIFVRERESDTEKDFVDNFANQLCSIQKEDSMVVVETIGDEKLSIKVFYGFKYRRKGCHWFKVSRNMDFLTVNKKTGDVYNGSMLNYQKKRKFQKKIKKNYFVSDPISTINHRIRTSFPENWDQIAVDVLSVFFENLNLGSATIGQKELIKFYLDKKNVKYPNNFHIFFKTYGVFPTLKDLRKHNMKLVDAFMYKHDLKGDVIKKVIHSLKNNITVEAIKSVMNHFPKDWVLQDEDFVKLCMDVESSYGLNLSNFHHFTSKSELRSAFECLRLSYRKEIDSLSFSDHCEFYSYLKSHGEKIKWKSKNVIDFQKEHLDWSDLYQFYKKGFYTRIYPQDLHDSFKIPIQHLDDVYYPVILLNSDEYNAESGCQNNCVKTYIGRPSSIIISLRKDSTISTERATIEYQIFKKNGKITFNRPQSLGKFNSWLPDVWNEPLKLLDERMEKYVGDGNKITTVKIEKLLHNHKTLYSDSDWAENGFLFWTYNLINKDNFSNYYLNGLQF